MIHKEFFGILFLGFVAWCFLTTNPMTRIERGCAPVSWVGGIVVSATALTIPDSANTVQSSFNKLDYGCQYIIWRIAYQDAYIAEQKAKSDSDAKAPEEKSEKPKESSIKNGPVNKNESRLP